MKNKTQREVPEETVTKARHSIENLQEKMSDLQDIVSSYSELFDF